MNKSKFLITITSEEMLEKLKKVGFTNFLFPLEDFCVGIPKTFSLEKIKDNGYLYINRLLDEEGIQKLKEIMRGDLSQIKGIVFEDFGVLELINELDLSVEKILCQTHFAANYESVNDLNEFVDSVFICTDITKEEIKNICKRSTKPVCLFYFGTPPVMMSRRTLLTNFERAFHTEKKQEVILEEPTSNETFKAVENNYGTVIYHNAYYDGRELKDAENVKYFWIHPLFLEEDVCLKTIEKLTKGNTPNNLPISTGFLHKKTITKLKDVAK